MEVVDTDSHILTLKHLYVWCVNLLWLLCMYNHSNEIIHALLWVIHIYQWISSLPCYTNYINIHNMHTYVCMYACVYLCMYVCMYIRTYVCMYICMCVCLSVCMYIHLSTSLYTVNMLFYYTLCHMYRYVFMYVCIIVCKFLSGIISLLEIFKRKFFMVFQYPLKQFNN